MSGKAPDISIAIPIHNEEGILVSAVNDLLVRLQEFGRSFELILAENGSSDRTFEIAEKLASKHQEIATFSMGEPNYGLALRRAIENARGKFVICDEVDICDVDFYSRALELLDRGEAEFVVGSKSMPGAEDRRPLFRRTATVVINSLLRMTLGFRGTDTHGLKAFSRETLAPVVASCVVDKDLFASELVIRAYRKRLKVVEIPVTIAEKRPPSIELTRRVPAVLKGLWRLYRAIESSDETE